jgi:DNA polymerase-3 subunit alpha
VEGITEKISKKGNKFGIISLMDFHGSMELTVFEKQLELLSRRDLEKPLCFKVDVSNDGQNTKMRVMKIMELGEAKKEKIETKVIEVPQEPKVLLLDLSDDTSKLEFLYQIVRQNGGRRPLHLVITSKLQDVVIETGFCVDDSIDEQIAALEYVKVV